MVWWGLRFFELDRCCCYVNLKFTFFLPVVFLFLEDERVDARERADPRERDEPREPCEELREGLREREN